MINKIIFRRAVAFFMIAVSIAIAVTIITYTVNPDFKNVVETFEMKSSDQFREATDMKKVWFYVVNNGFVVPFQMFALTLIPVQFLYLVNIISTALMPGILFGIILQTDSRKGMEIIASTVPHFVIEIFAFCLLAAVLFELNQVIRSKIKNWFKKDQKELSLVDKVFKTLRFYVAVVLPMMIVAAFVETYVADIIFNLFQL
ncbi:stage II sporulation protein M [Sporosarcina sp. Te-1]|uniref:stage II sporulation protein M n=1 Tax=Sporosarcina sp. Te-1 TaxID=2818390 RepID=UPI001A9F88E5|nr:stage II sporulation protein M [Sporosarcina sp. Te-1]QTD39983.1 stage II sporulation protein M [Sporosarcina sp. Te-1]